MEYLATYYKGVQIFYRHDKRYSFSYRVPPDAYEKEYKYGWLHLPSGKHGVSTVILPTGNHERHYLLLLTQWSTAQLGTWAYYPLGEA